MSVSWSLKPALNSNRREKATQLRYRQSFRTAPQNVYVQDPKLLLQSVRMSVYTLILRALITASALLRSSKQVGSPASCKRIWLKLTTENKYLQVIEPYCSISWEDVSHQARIESVDNVGVKVSNLKKAFESLECWHQHQRKSHLPGTRLNCHKRLKEINYSAR